MHSLCTQNRFHYICRLSSVIIRNWKNKITWWEKIKTIFDYIYHFDHFTELDPNLDQFFMVLNQSSFLLLEAIIMNSQLDH